MKSKITIQDIADSLHLSRATVSKVLNHAPGVSEDTREAVMSKIMELNYKNTERSYRLQSHSESTGARNLAFLMHTMPGNLHVGSTIMAQLEQEIRKKGYSLTIHTITNDDYRHMELPPNLYVDQTAAFVCLELFNSRYSQLLCEQNVPVLFVDACADFHELDLQCDLLMMESRSSVYRMLTALCQKNPVRTMGYFGDPRHCLSFRERYEGLQLAALDLGITTEHYHIIDSDIHFWNPEWIARRIQQMPQLPDLFFCANDVLAQNLIFCLNELGYRVPEDVLICGFDGIQSNDPVISRLTTVQTPSTKLGVMAAQILMNKIQNPRALPTSTYLHTDVLFRETAPLKGSDR